MMSLNQVFYRIYKIRLYVHLYLSKKNIRFLQERFMEDFPEVMYNILRTADKTARKDVMYGFFYFKNRKTLQIVFQRRHTAARYQKSRP